MWVVAKVKIKELKIFEKNFIEKAGNDAQFYYPKIEYYKYFGNKVKKSEKFVLENSFFGHMLLVLYSTRIVILNL